MGWSLKFAEMHSFSSFREDPATSRPTWDIKRLEECHMWPRSGTVTLVGLTQVA